MIVLPAVTTIFSFLIHVGICCLNSVSNVNVYQQLVGTYQPPPGSTVSAKTDSSISKGSQTRPQLWDVGTSDLSGEDGFFKVTASLPTSPVTDKEWSAIWPHPISQRRNLKEGFLRGALAPFRPTSPEILESLKSKERLDKEEIKSQSHLILNQVKLGTSLKVDEKGLREIKPSSKDDVEAQDVSLILRESPDGSSDNSDWTATSPVSQPSMFLTKETSQLSTNSSSTISRLVHGKNILMITSHTGARPKELLTTEKLRDQCVVLKQNVDISNIVSEIGSSISPSLLQVNYGGECTTSEGDSSSTNSIHRPQWCQGIRTSQLRHRANSGRLASVPADSDQDSEDTADGTPSQASRRRRRLPPSQHHAGLSVKLLVDSRGVLESEGDPQNSTSKNHEGNVSEQFEHCGNIKASDQHSVKSDSSLQNNCNVTLRTSDLPQSIESPATSDTSVVSKSNPSHVMSTPVSADHHTDVVDGVAFSAPERIIKPKLLPNEATKTHKKTHGRSRSDGSQELMGKLRLSQSNLVSEFEAKINSTKLETAKGDSEVGLPIQVHKRFMEDGGHSITPAADNGFFPRPQPGQSLIEFLSSKEFQKQYAELDRENAHFNISEAVIAALTQVRHLFSLFKHLTMK